MGGEGQSMSELVKVLSGEGLVSRPDPGGGGAISYNGKKEEHGWCFWGEVASFPRSRFSLALPPIRARLSSISPFCFFRFFSFALLQRVHLKVITTKRQTTKEPNKRERETEL